MKVEFLSQRVIASIWFGALAFLAYFIWSGIFFGFTLNPFDIFKLVFTFSALLVGFLYGYKTIINHRTKLSLISSTKGGIAYIFADTINTISITHNLLMFDTVSPEQLLK